MDKTAIILDLDNTIFETRSINKNVFQDFFNHFARNLKPLYSSTEITLILDDLWDKTWQEVLVKYNIPEKLLLDAFQILDKTEMNLNISTYTDYAYIKKIECPKFLVTTSLTSLQIAKIKALNIEGDFTKIVINDTFKESKTKQDIFKELLLEYNLIPEFTYVIGDNAESEIKAGNSLNMLTIQILRPGVIKGNNARYYIESFKELEKIMFESNN